MPFSAVEKQRAYDQARQRTPERRAAMNQATERWRIAHPERYALLKFRNEIQQNARRRGNR